MNSKNDVKIAGGHDHSGYEGKPEMAPISLKIPKELKRKMDRFAAEHDIYLREIIIDAVGKYIQPSQG